MSKVWRTLTVLVAVGAVLGVMAAVVIPSLLRARVSPGLRSQTYEVMPAPVAPPPTMPAFARTYETERSAPKIDGFTPATPAPMNTEAYRRIVDNAFLNVADSPLSTFSIDVDTASYANVRRFLREGQLPPKDAVRIEELVNYFPFDYPAPEDGTPFSVDVARRGLPLEPRPPARAHRAAGPPIAGRADSAAQPRLPDRRVRLDERASQAAAGQGGLGLLVDQLSEQDRIAIVVYAGASGLVLPPTSGDRKGEIRAAIDALEAGGSTAGGAGIQLAYETAREAFIEGGVNRVILATDGDFNVGITSEGDLVPPHRAEAQDGRLAHRPRLRHGQPQGLDDGDARGQGQRQLRVHRHAGRGAQGAGDGGGLHPGHGRQRREAAGRVQSGRGGGVSPHRLREPRPRGRRLQRRRQGRRRHRRGPQRDRALRGRSRGRAEGPRRVDPLRYQEPAARPRRPRRTS